MSEKLIRDLFSFQSFSANDEISEMIQEAEDLAEGYQILSDEVLAFAAGGKTEDHSQGDSQKKIIEKLEGK